MNTDRWERTVKNWRRLKRAGVGTFVVFSPAASQAGLSTQYPVGLLVRIDPVGGVAIRHLGQSRVVKYSALFWQPAPSRLANLLVASFPSALPHLR